MMTAIARIARSLGLILFLPSILPAAAVRSHLSAPTITSLTWAAPRLSPASTLTPKLLIQAPVMTLVPGVSAAAPMRADALPYGTQGDGASAPTPVVSALPVSQGSELTPAANASLQAADDDHFTPQMGAALSLRGLVAQMESSRTRGKDSNQLSQRFFDQSGTRGPPASVEVSDVSAPKLPPGVKSVSVDTVRTAADIERLIPNGLANKLKAELESKISEMAPYQIYNYYDSQGGHFTGIDISARPSMVDQIPDMRPHEARLVKKLMLVDSDIRVLVREDGKTPDLVIGDEVVEMKSWFVDRDPLEKLLTKANSQVSEHGRRHGLGHGAVAVDLVGEPVVPVAQMPGLLNAWQARTHEPVVLDQVIIFGETDMQVYARQADGTYRIAAPASMARGVVNERPLAPAEKGKAQAMLRNGIEESPALALSL